MASYQAENPYRNSRAPGGRTNPRDISDLGAVSDTTKDAVNTTHSTSNRAAVGLHTGIIHYVDPASSCYEVSLSSAGSGLRVVCSMLAPLSFDVFSVSSNVLLLPGTRVWLFVYDHLNHGVIVGVLPGWQTAAGTIIYDQGVVSSGSGYRYDEGWYLHLLEKYAGGMINFNEGLLTDLLPGDWAIASKAGLLLRLTQFHLLMRATDLARIDMFYLDNMVRFTTANFEHYSEASERHLKNDEGEISDVHYLTPYPWEGAGLRAPGNPFRDGNFTWSKESMDGGREPQMPDQTGVWRRHHYLGYLGDIDRLLISVPPDQEGPERMRPDEPPHPGLLEQRIGIEGAYSLTAAKDIIFRKHVRIAVPRRIREMDDPEGDSAVREGGNYKSSGQFGAGPDHVKTEFTWGSDLPGVRGAQLTDLHVYMSNWYGIMPTVRHEKDFEVPQLSDVKLGGLEEDDFLLDDLASSFSAALPESVSVRVDHRTTVKYFKGSSVRAMLDDGSIVDEDAYGSQMRMGAGNMEFSCPGDIILRPGRSLIVMAPLDAIIRSGHSTDITAAKGDVTIKAEKDVKVLSGNGGQGGILLESRAKGATIDFVDKIGDETVTSGVIVRTKSAPFMVQSDGVFMRSKGSAPVVINSNDGEGSILLDCGSLHAIASRQIGLLCNASVKGVDAPSNAVMVLPTSTFMMNDLLVNGAGRFLASDGSASLLVQGPVTALGTIAGPSRYVAQINVAAAKQEINQERWFQDFENLPTTLQDDLLAPFNLLFYQEPNQDPEAFALGWSYDDFVDSIGITLRTDAQYGREGDDSFMLFEAPWQKKMRIAGRTTIWDEPAVQSPHGVDTRPYPGNANWETEKRFGTIDDTYYDQDAKCGRDRPYDSETLPPKELQVSTLKDAYLITAQAVPAGTGEEG